MALLSFVIPCYRSEFTIEKVYREICKVMSERSGFEYEIIAVNDCSPDKVLTVLRGIAKDDKRFKVINLSKNFGKHSAVMAGLANARGDYIVNLDDDYQCPVNMLWSLMDPLVYEGYDCATAVYTKKQEALWKRAGSAVNATMIRVMLDVPQDLVFENFYVFKKYICEEILRYSSPYPYISGLILRSTSNIKMVVMNERARDDGRASGFTLKKSIDLLLNGLTSFSVKPLRLATVLGFVTAVFGFILAIYIIIKKIINPSVAIGYTSLMAAILFSAGMIMMMLGIIGEYVGRIFISINNSPQYVIESTINI